MNLSRIRNLISKRIPSTYAIFETRGLFANKNTCKSLIFKLDSTRLVSTVESKTLAKETSTWNKFLKRIPFLNIDEIKTKGAAYLLYENIADKLDYVEIIEKFKLADTFYSWFVITEVHIWMISARAMADGTQGKYLRNNLVEALWADVAKRTKKLGEANPAAMRTQINELSEQLQATFIAYDEGLQSDDTVLASAVWRRWYHKEYASPQHIEEIVSYIRKHISLLDSLSIEQILTVEAIKWDPL